MADGNGYAQRVLRVDLSRGLCTVEERDSAFWRTWVGGSGFGARTLYDEVPASVTWNDPDNRLIFASGPLAATAVMGSGTVSIVSKGPLTNGATTTQANGFFGAYIKLAGFDAIIVEGAAKSWQYLHLHDGKAELRDATSLLGLDTWETQDTLTEQLGLKERQLSVFGIGPAGENLVHYAAICGDHGHVAGHNGVGAVMGSKKLKAVAAQRGGARFGVYDRDGLKDAANRIIEHVSTDPWASPIFHWGTSLSYAAGALAGWLPVKNLTTNIFPEYERFGGESYRQRYEMKRMPCYSCRSHHLHMMRIPDGPFAGFEGEEPEYEQFASWGSLVGNTDVDAAFVLSNQVDRWGMETNELSWTIAWAIECFEKGIINEQDTDGLKLAWGDMEAITTLAERIAHREGAFADMLAKGVKRAAETLGRGSKALAVYTGRNTSPRTHDHRGRWIELLDTVVSNTGTMEIGQPTYTGELGAPANPDPFSVEDTALVAGKTNGRMLFEDCLGTCRFTTRVPLPMLMDALNAATGWDYDPDEAMATGRRVAHILRAFNILHGHSPQQEFPSARYGSVPHDGPAKGRDFSSEMPVMRQTMYELMGWDLETGKPTAEVLKQHGLADVSKDMWGKTG